MRIAFSVLLSLALAAPALAQQTSYPLVCRSGSQMSASVQGNGAVNLGFRAGGQAASAGAPAAGECRWLDRGFRQGEPTRMILPSGNAQNALYLVGALVRGETFYVHVFNDGSGNMRITRVGP